MPLSFIVRFRPTGPWRFGPDSGAREQVNLLFHSDAVYSAVTNAMSRLGLLEDWLAATAQSETGSPAVRFSSFFPFQKDQLFVVPPQGVWPPPPSAKIRYKGARFVPVSVVSALLNEKPIDEDRWQVDGESACMIPSGWQDGPFRTSLRSAAGVDRLEPGKVDVHQTACLEFSRDCGVWMLVVFSDEAAHAQWDRKLRGALRLLADSGFGGERSRGWGRSTMPKWDKADALMTMSAPTAPMPEPEPVAAQPAPAGQPPAEPVAEPTPEPFVEPVTEPAPQPAPVEPEPMVTPVELAVPTPEPEAAEPELEPEPEPAPEPEPEPAEAELPAPTPAHALIVPKAEPVKPLLAYWLLSLYVPSDADTVDWTRGHYSTVTRSGRTETPARWGELKSPTLMVAEGSVLLAAEQPNGVVRDVAPQGFPHPVYRSGFAVSIPIPWRVPA